MSLVLVAGGCATRLSECPDAGCQDGVGNGGTGGNGNGGNGGSGGGNVGNGGDMSFGPNDLGFIILPFGDMVASSNDCQSILSCVEGCQTSAKPSPKCVQACAASGSPMAQQQFAALLSCVEMHCAQDMSPMSVQACDVNAVSGPNAPCAKQFAACQ